MRWWCRTSPWAPIKAAVTVLVVGPDNVVAEKHVTTGPLEGALRVIEAGLTTSDLVVVEGLQRAIPGQTVEPVTVNLADAASGSAADAVPRAVARAVTGAGAETATEASPAAAGSAKDAAR